MAPNCPFKDDKGLKLCGHGLPGQMFYSLHVPIEEEDAAKMPITAVMKVLEGKGSVARITTELQYLLNPSWDWQVKKIAVDEYMFVVPSAKDLEFLTRIREFKGKITDMTVTVDKSEFMVGCCDLLSQVWVQVCGFPYWARKEKAVEEVSYLVGDFIEVDKKSLPGLGPIRLKVACKDPSTIKGSSRVYFNGRGFLISWNLESDKNFKRPIPPDDNGKKKDDDEAWEDDGDEDSDSYDPWADFRKNSQEQPKEITESSKQGEHRGVKQVCGDVIVDKEDIEKGGDAPAGTECHSTIAS
jgi:hypothetical protein